MACIYIQNDYNTVEDTFTVIKGKVIHPANPKVTLSGKFFKFLPTIWAYLDEDPSLVESNTEISPLLDEYYCTTREIKSLYLHQLYILFKRLNTIKTGKNLLKCLSTYMPLNKNYTSEKSLINKNNFIIDNRTKKKHRFNLLIVPPRGYMKNGVFKLNDNNVNTICESPLFGNACIMHFIPNLLEIYKVNDKIIYKDPALTLARELIYALHNILGLGNLFSLYYSSKGGLVEEKLTFGVNNFKDLSSKISHILEKKLISTAKVLNLSKDEANIKEDFAKQFCLTKLNDKYMYENKEQLTLYLKSYVEINELCISKELNIPERENYKDAPVYLYKINVEDRNFYTIEKGINLDKIPQLKAHYAFLKYFGHIFGRPLDKVYKGDESPSLRRYYI